MKARATAATGEDERWCVSVVGHGSASRLDFRGLRRPDGRLLLVLLFTIDALIVSLHLSQKLLGDPESPIFDLGADRSYGELLIYVKLVWIAILCVLLARRRRASVFAALAIAAIVLLAEDALILHERLARSLSGTVVELIPAIAGIGILRHQVVELVWFALVGTVITVIAVVGYIRASPPNRRDALSIAVFFGVLAVFAIGVDTIHSFFPLRSVGDLIFTVLEDGGELVALSPAVALAFALATQREGATPMDASAAGAARAQPTPDTTGGSTADIPGGDDLLPDTAQVARRVG